MMPTLKTSFRSPLRQVLTLVVAVAGSAFVGVSATDAGDDSRRVAEITKTGYGGHPYLWAPPTC